jgi:CMP-N,N'-diacetyllegionaminic acid synthase
MVKKIPAIIPARGGSKGLPGKNIKVFAGKPLIAWSIEAALSSETVSDVIVSTDDPQIAEVAVSSGALVPFLRPAELAQDRSQAVDAYIYTVNQLNKKHGFNINEFLVLQPTSPLRTSFHIDEAVQLFQKMKADSLISVYENPHPLEWVQKISKDGYLRNVSKHAQPVNRQEYSKTFLPNGAILILQYSLLERHKTYYYKKTVPFIMDRKDSIDIDDEFDFTLGAYLKMSVN